MHESHLCAPTNHPEPAEMVGGFSKWRVVHKEQPTHLCAGSAGVRAWGLFGGEFDGEAGAVGGAGGYLDGALVPHDVAGDYGQA
ncbi:hypothetical protein GCM10009745_81660 [Kribbella yunnanensis]|uniref:Uncharacterized protein n=1 Tax=Kribbella yunnanensis TaxID=190194 RepID=A0ABN2J8Q1_9ACTN